MKTTFRARGISRPSKEYTFVGDDGMARIRAIEIAFAECGYPSGYYG